MNPAEVSEALGLDTLKGRQWSIHKSCAIKGEGLDEGLDWCVSSSPTPLLVCHAEHLVEMLCVHQARDGPAEHVKEAYCYKTTIFFTPVHQPTASMIPLPFCTLIAVLSWDGHIPDICTTPSPLLERERLDSSLASCSPSSSCVAHQRHPDRSTSIHLAEILESRVGRGNSIPL
jgi:ADP-ribosylation factor family